MPAHSRRRRLTRVVAYKLGLLSSLCLFHGAVSAQPPSTSPSVAREPPRLLDEIIVTAQKRDESIQHIPLAVTGMNAAMIQETGVKNFVELAELQPSVSLETAQSFQRTGLRIRGIGTIGNSRSFEGAVGVFIDGVYRPRNGMVLADLLHIDSLEILRGPQGTLFGKNSTAGAISLWSTKPNSDALEGNAEVRAGNFDTTYLAGAVNVPINRSGALRFAGTYHQRDGFFVSPDNGDQYDAIDRYSFKSQLLLNPMDNLEVLLIADYAQSDAKCCWGAAIAVNGPTAPLINAYGTLNGLTFVPPPDAEQDRLESLNSLPAEEIDDKGLTARVTWDTPAATLTSITGIRDWSHAQINADADFSPATLFVLDEPATIDTLSQEFNVRVLIGGTDLLLGLYYATEDYESVRSVGTGADADNYLNALISASQGAAACLPPVVAVDCLFPAGISALLPSGLFTLERYQQDGRSNALFAHSSTRLSEKIDLIMGLRYSIENKEGGVDNLFWYDSALVRAVLAGAGIPDDGTPRNGLDLIGTVYGPSFHADYRDETNSGVLSLQYFASADIMVYGGYSRGYKAGGVNLFREGAITSPTYASEFADSFELGLKAEYWGGGARTNVAIFDTKFSDLQMNFFTGLEFRTENVGETTTRGVEIESVFQVTDNLRADLSVTYLDSTFGDLSNPLLDYLDDRDMPAAPEWAAVAALRYEKPLAGGMTLTARALASYVGDHFVGAEIPSEQKADSYLTTDLDIGLRSADGRWETVLWCTNCSDQSYRTVFFNTTFQPGSYSVYLNAPRQYGVTLRAAF